MLFDTITALLGQVQSGQVMALGVTGKDRFPATPNIPPVIESGVVPNYDVTTWYGLYGPKGMPPAVIAKLNKTLNEMLQEAAIRERLGKIGVVVKGSTPAELAPVHGGRARQVERSARKGGARAAIAIRTAARSQIFTPA